MAKQIKYLKYKPKLRYPNLKLLKHRLYVAKDKHNTLTIAKRIMKELSALHTG